MNGFRTKPEVEHLEEVIRDVHYRLIRLTKSDLLESGLSPARFHVLHYVFAHGPVDMGSLHSHMHVSKSSLTSLVDGLVDESLLARERSSADRRRVLLHVTDGGRLLLNRIRLLRCRYLDEAMTQLDAAAIENLATALESIRTNLEV